MDFTYILHATWWVHLCTKFSSTPRIHNDKWMDCWWFSVILQTTNTWSLTFRPIWQECNFILIKDWICGQITIIATSSDNFQIGYTVKCDLIKIHTKQNKLDICVAVIIFVNLQFTHFNISIFDIESRQLIFFYFTFESYVPTL
jgi:hypothetical protein